MLCGRACHVAKKFIGCLSCHFHMSYTAIRNRKIRQLVVDQLQGSRIQIDQWNSSFITKICESRLELCGSLFDKLMADFKESSFFRG